MAPEHAPRLEPRLFHPRYWGSWLGLSLLWLLVLLPVIVLVDVVILMGLSLLLLLVKKTTETVLMHLNC